MLSRVFNYFRSPIVASRKNNIRAYNLFMILPAAFLLTFLYLIQSLMKSSIEQIIAASLLIGTEVGAFILVRSGRTRLASILFSSSLLVAFIFLSALLGWGQEVGYTTFALVIVIAELTLGIWGGVFFFILAALSSVGVLQAQKFGLLQASITSSDFTNLAIQSSTYLGILFLVYLSIRNYSTTSAGMGLLDKQIQEMEVNIQKKQLDLDAFAEKITRLTKEFDAVKNIKTLQTDPSVLERDLLLLIADLIQKDLELDKVNIYLLDDSGYSAFLIGPHADKAPESITIFPEEQLFFNTTDVEIGSYVINERRYNYSLPKASGDTLASYFVYPMIASSQVIGFVSIQTSKTGMPPSLNLALNIIVNDIALAVDKRRLLSLSQEQAKEIELLSGNVTQKAWKNIEAGKSLGYLYDRLQVLPGGDTYPVDVMERILSGLSASYTLTGDKPSSKLISPIKVRNQVIGIIGYDDRDPAHDWENDQVVFLETVAAQIGLALENSRLISEAQQRAQNERIVSEVTSSVRATLNFDTILQTAVQEIQRSLNLKEAEIRLASTDESIKEIPSKRAPE